MAGKTIRRCAFEHIVCMTRLAGNICVRTLQREPRAAMVKGSILPLGGVMALRTNRPELTVVGIFRGMTGDTFLGCSFINAVNMTGCTRRAGVSTCQRKACHLAVIEVDILPLAWVMTGTAVGPKLPIVGVI